MVDHNNDQLLVHPNQLPQENSKQQKPTSSKRHISFGDVVVRNNSMIHPVETPIITTSPSPPPPSSSNSTSVVGTPPRKSRFVIEETSRDQQINSNNNDYTYSSSVRSSSPLLEDDHHSDGEVMKGRFYVNQQNKPVTFNETPIIHHDDDHPLHKVSSQDAINTDRKQSRFEISSATNSPMIYQPIPLSRDSSSYSSSSNGRGTNNTTAVIEKRYPLDTSTLTSENIALLTESSRKIGRFELTGGSTSASSSVDVTPRGSISSSHIDMLHHHNNNNSVHHHSNLSTTTSDSIHNSNNSNVQYQIEELMRFNESQRMLLQELSMTFKKPTAVSDHQPYFHQQHQDYSNLNHINNR